MSELCPVCGGEPGKCSWFCGIDLISPETRQAWTENKYVAHPLTYESMRDHAERLKRRDG